MIEWHEGKRQQTLLHRGLDFADIEFVDWNAADTIEDLRKDYGEARYFTFAPIKGRLCVFAWTWRDGNIRVISLRKANQREVKEYERRRR